MYDSHTRANVGQLPEGNDVYARLKWLVAVNALEEQRRKLFRSSLEEQEMMLMRRPLPAERAFGLFGLLLGLLPPAAIFIKIFGYGLGTHESALLFLACVLMNVVCAGIGYRMGSLFGQTIETLERASWTRMLIALPFIGTAWGAVTGGAGGLIFLGFGAIFGSIFAVPVGALALTMFAALHRLVARGGMIDARHFWPLACGVVMMTTALILGL